MTADRPAQKDSRTSLVFRSYGNRCRLSLLAMVPVERSGEISSAGTLQRYVETRGRYPVQFAYSSAVPDC